MAVYTVDTGLKTAYRKTVSFHMDNKSKIFVGNMHRSTSEGDLIKIFQTVGTVKDVTYLWHKFGPNKGQPKGFAFIEMSSENEVAKAIRTINGSIVKGKKLYVSQAENEKMLCSDSNRTGQTKFNFTKRKLEHEGDTNSLNPSKIAATEEKYLTTDINEKMRKLQQALSILHNRK